MNNTFSDCEKLYRAVFPASYIQMFWKKDGTISSAAFSDREGLSVERGKPYCQGVHIMALGWESKIPDLLKLAEI